MIPSQLNGSRTVIDIQAQISLDSSRYVSTCRACRAVLFDKLDTAEMHGLDTSNVSCRVETWRDEPSGIWA